jgi:hypothetical protein
MFPWRTISGEEASAYYAAGTAQYHIPLWKHSGELGAAGPKKRAA